MDAISYETDLPEEWAQFQAINAEFFGDQGGHVDVIALRRHVGADAAEGWEILRYRHLEHAGGCDAFEGIGQGGARGECE